MTTPRTTSLVSLAAALALTLTLAGCASASAHQALEEAVATEASPAVRFVNEGRDYVHVYLVGEKREWLLGRVEPGARATLRIPDAALADDAGPLRLAVLAGERVTLSAAGEVRASSMIAQPAAAFLTQRWTFSQSLAKGQLTPLPAR
jgi:hypothetical protein